MNPWLIVAAVVGTVLLAGGSYLQGRKDGGAAVRSAQARALADADARAREADQRYADASSLLQQANATIGTLINTRPDPQKLIVQVPTHAPVTSCPDRSDDYWVQWNAIAAGPAPGTPANLP